MSTPDTTVVDPGEGFKVLRRGQIIRVGDEWKDGRKWKPVPEEDCNVAVCIRELIVRRRIQPSPADARQDGPGLSAQIMNLPNKCTLTRPVAVVAYKLGHRDARHAAAELAAATDARVRELETCLRGIIENNGIGWHRLDAVERARWTKRAEKLLATPSASTLTDGVTTLSAKGGA